MALIQAVAAKEILDGRGIPTIETTIWLDNGLWASSSVASGMQTGKFEGVQLRDQDPARMIGKGVLKAVANVNEVIGPQLIGKDPSNQEEIDQLMINLDATSTKSKLGANTMSSVSQAVIKAAAMDHGLPLYSYVQQRYQFVTQMAIPTCLFGMVDGGEHGSDNVDFQEFQIIPASFMEYPNALNLAVTFQSKLEEVLITKKAIHSVGVLGGFAPSLFSNTDVFELLIETLKATQYTFAQDVFFGVDAAANTLYFNGKYQLKDKNTAYTTKELFEYYQNIRTVYKAIYFEDPFAIADKSGWKDLVEQFGEATRISADALTDSNITQIDAVVKEKLANTFVLKPSKVGTITELMAAVRYLRQTDHQIVIAHRSGETADDFIADLAVGIGADYCKFGPVMREERLAKYNRLTQIHLELTTGQKPLVPTPVLPPQAAAIPPELMPAAIASDQADPTASPLQIVDTTTPEAATTTEEASLVPPAAATDSAVPSTPEPTPPVATAPEASPIPETPAVTDPTQPPTAIS